MTGVVLTGALLYAVFFAGARSANPLTIILVIAFTVIPVAGVADQALSTALSVAIGVGLGTGVLVSGVSHAFFPDAPAPANIAAAPATVSPETASWKALQATLVVMPVFVLALTNPAFYLAAIMKTVTLGQQAGATNARSAGRELVGSTLMGAWMAAAGLVRPVAAAEPVDADAVDGGCGALGRRQAVRSQAHVVSPIVLEQRPGDDADPAGARHRGRCRRQGCLQRFCHARRAVRRGGALRMGNGVGT